MSQNNRFSLLALNSADVKYKVWTEPRVLLLCFTQSNPIKKSDHTLDWIFTCLNGQLNRFLFHHNIVLVVVVVKLYLSTVTINKSALPSSSALVVFLYINQWILHHFSMKCLKITLLLKVMIGQDTLSYN